MFLQSSLSTVAVKKILRCRPGTLPLQRCGIGNGYGIWGGWVHGGTEIMQLQQRSDFRLLLTLGTWLSCSWKEIDRDQEIQKLLEVSRNLEKSITFLDLPGDQSGCWGSLIMQWIQRLLMQWLLLLQHIPIFLIKISELSSWGLYSNCLQLYYCTFWRVHISICLG